MPASARKSTGIAFIAAQQDKKSMGQNVNKTAGSCF